MSGAGFAFGLAALVDWGRTGLGGDALVQQDEVLFLVGLLMFGVFVWGVAASRGRAAGGGYWQWAWAALLAVPVAEALADRVPAAHAFANGLAGLFPVLTLVGTLVFCGLAVPRWLLPAGFAWALGRVGLTLAGFEGVALAVPLVGEVPLLVIAGVVMARASPGIRSVEGWVAVGLVAAALLDLVDVALDVRAGQQLLPILPWFAVGVPLATLQAVAIMGRHQRSVERQRDALSDAEERFALLSRQSDALISEVGPDGRLVYASANHEDVLGYAPDALVGRHIVDLMTDLESDRLEDLEPSGLPDLEEITQRAPRGTLSRLRARDGGWRWFESHATSHRTSDGGLRTLVVSRDVSGRIDADRERRALEGRMQQAQKLESLGVMAGGIAHDFNNLLVGIRGNAELALDALADAPDVRARVADIEEAADRAAELTQQLLAYAGKARFTVRTLDLSELVRDMAKLLRANVPAAVDLRFEREAEAWVHADPTQIRQVVLNLITNAAEALGQGPGTVSVSAGVMLGGRDYLAGCYLTYELGEGRYSFVEVADDGPGIESDDLGRIFDPFFTTKVTGRGLGLAAVLGIVRSHRGTIRVETGRGRGTAFRVLLPEADAAEEHSLDEIVAPPLEGRGTVLVVDDEALVRRVARQMLAGQGYEVIEAGSGDEALRAFEAAAGEIRCVLLDVTMPELDGVRTLELLRERRADLPVVLMSGRPEREVRTRLGGEPRTAFLHKPFRLASLAEKLREAFGRPA